MNVSRLAVLCVFLLLSMAAVSAKAQSVDFSWDQATIYHLITDRFSNGDLQNDSSYGHGLDGLGNAYDVDSTGHFLGGDFLGLTGWIEDGYFNDLGINALLISTPIEQVHGWIGGGFGEFQRYAYDGQWPLDYTLPDLALGDEKEFEMMMAAAHAKGLRVVVEVNLNSVGFATLNDMAAFGFGGITTDEWRTWRPASKSGWQSYNDRMVTITDSTESWSKWWGPEWILADLPGYEACGADEWSKCLNMQPDLRDDVEVTGLPDFLKLKWGEEKIRSQTAMIDAFFSRTGYTKTAVNHVILWLSEWVRLYGIDGFVLNNPENVSPNAILRLKEQGSKALKEWKSVHSELSLDDSDFWLSGDVLNHDLQKSEYFQMGFDAVYNYAFLKDLDGGVDAQFSTYSESINKDGSFNVLSFFSSGKTGLFDRPSAAGAQKLKDAATQLILSPGAVVVYYGDESRRQLGEAGVDEMERTKSKMNWTSFDEDLFQHWKKIASFRATHPAIAEGGHDNLSDDPYTFYRGVRRGLGTDEVVVVVGASGKTRVNVSIVWPDDTVLRDAYTGNVSIVSFGQATFPADASGLILIEEVK